MKRILTLALILLSIMAEASVIKVKVRNLGDGTVSYMKSTNGMITTHRTYPSLDSDSCFMIDTSDYQGIDVITLNCQKGQENYFKPIWTPFAKNVTIDLNTESKIDSDEDASIKAANEIAEQFNSDFFDYMTGKSDKLQLRKDTVAESAYRKLTSHCDSLTTIIERSVPENFTKVLRQDIAINALFWFYQCAGAAKYVEPSLSDKNIAEWESKLFEMKNNLDLNDSANALNYLFKETVAYYFSDDAVKRGLISGPVSNDVSNKMFFDYVNNNLKGKAAETVCGRIIIEDTEQGKFSKGIPELAEDFYASFPESALASIINEAVAKNKEMNAPKDMTGINFINVDSIKNVNDLIALYRGKPVLLDIWATWCGPCRKSFKELGPIRQYAAEKGIVLLYISIDEGEDIMESVKDVAGKYGVKGDHVVATGDLREDVFTSFGNSDGMLGIPHTAFFDKDGKMVVKHFQESENPAELLKRLKTIMP